MAQINLLLQAETSQAKKNVDNYTRSLNQNATAGTKASQATQSVGNAAKGTVTPIRGAGVDMRNLSYQIQDVAVQAGMGTDALRILSMQGPQIASAFGPAGAAYGAVIAIGAAVAGALLPSLLNGKDAFEELGQSADEFGELLEMRGLSVKGFSDELINMAEASRPAALIAITGQIATMQEQTINATKAIHGMVGGFMDTASILRRDAREELRSFGDGSEETANRLENLNNNLDEFERLVTNFTPENALTTQQELADLLQNTTNEALREQIVLFSQNAFVISQAEAVIKGLTDAQEQLATGINLTNQSGQSQIDLYTERLMALRLTNEELDMYKITTMDISNADKLRLIDLQTLIDREKEYLSVKETQHNALMSFSNDLFANESKNTQAMARMGINLLNQEKRANAAKILSDSYTAAMSAYKALAGIPLIGPALGAAAAGTILAAGVSYSAKSLQGRALGGQVRDGESYIVGERGPEVLTMGSSRGFITPNDQLRQQTVNNAGNVANVTFNITANDTTGFDELLNKRRGQIIGMVNQALNNSGRSNLV